MQEHKRTTETEEEKLVLPARPSSLEGAVGEGAGRKSDLSVAQIREWVEVYRAANDNKFPSCESGQVLNADGSPAGESWKGLDSLFNYSQKGRPARGLGGLGFNSLRDFLDKTYPGEREVRIEKGDLSIDQIKVWVDVYREANDGKFPSAYSGAVLNADGSQTGERWDGLTSLFQTAQRGAPARGLGGLGFNSLRDFLDKTYPGEREVWIEKPDLSIEQIKGWVEVYRAANGGKFPSSARREVLNADGSLTGENWSGLDSLFRTAQEGAPARGMRGLGFESLTDFLDKTYPDERKVRVRIEKQDLSIEQIKGWVDVYRAANDEKFPSMHRGEILNADGSPAGERWDGLNALFRAAQSGRPARGLRGLGFKSLLDFLDKTYPDERKFRGEKQDLLIDQIKVWVDVYREANDGKFPSADSGAVLIADGSPTGETWVGLDALFKSAQKGFPARGLLGLGFNSLRDFLDKTYPGDREVRIEKQDLLIDQIKVWVDVYREANDGKFPSADSGAVLNADGSKTGENWRGLDGLFMSAQKGAPARGLGGLGFRSLRDFLDKTYPGERKFRGEKQELSIDQIKVWVDVYREANDGKFPSANSVEVLNADGSPAGESWKGLNSLFDLAQKGFPARGLQNSGFTSLRDFLDKTYPTERARERRAPTARPEVDDINVLLDLLE